MDVDGGGALTVLCWHNVAPTWRFAAPANRGHRGLTAQLAALRRFAYVVDLDAALADLAAGRRLPPRAVALTFDDGYADNLRFAAPLLRSLGLPATFFLAPGFLDATTVPWWERLAWAVGTSGLAVCEWRGTTYPLATTQERAAVLAAVERDVKRADVRDRTVAVDTIVGALEPTVPYGTRAAMLDWDGAAELVRRGFTVGSHSWRHVILANETTQAQRHDLDAARHALRERLGVPCDVLAYPNGTTSDFSTDTEEAARRAGHSAALTTIEGPNTAATPRFALRRFVVEADHGLAGLRRVLRSAATHALRASSLRGRSSGRPAVPL